MLAKWVNPLALMRKSMSRIAKSQPVSASMYKHFAIVTVVATACLAMFASGESRESIAREATRIAEKPNTPKASLQPEKARRQPAGSFGPEERVPSEDGDWWRSSPGQTTDPRKKKKKSLPGMQPPPGMGAMVVESDARGALVAVGEDAYDGKSGPDEVREDQIAALTAASLARSGSEAE